MHQPTVQERLNWPITPEVYAEIRRMWIAHSKAEDARDLPGLIDTLARDCVYTLIPTGQRWEGHDGAPSILHVVPRRLPRRAILDVRHCHWTAGSI
jgi:hypothetical protein